MSPLGLFGSARAALSALIEIGHTRAQLLSTELEEERIRVAELLLYATAALFLLGVGLVLAAMLLVLVFWDGPRLQVLAALTAAFLVGAAALAATWRHKSRSKPPFLSATVEELRRDRDGLRQGDAAGAA